MYSKFSNQTMRQPVEAKPHIAYVKGYWRVSPWRRDTAHLYYEAHRWAVYRNRTEHETGVANSSHTQRNQPTQSQADQNLDKQLRHAMNYNVGPAGLLAIIEHNLL